VARDGGCSASTVAHARRRWREHIREERDRLAEEVAASMLALVSAAVQAYSDLLSSNVPAVRLGAARDVVSHALRWRDAQEVEARLTALEQAPRP
jgi:hypothetical protein